MATMIYNTTGRDHGGVGGNPAVDVAGGFVELLASKRMTR
jgi:hypothetical protein